MPGTVGREINSARILEALQTLNTGIAALQAAIGGTLQVSLGGVEGIATEATLKGVGASASNAASAASTTASILDIRLPGQGSALMGASMPVTMAQDQVGWPGWDYARITRGRCFVASYSQLCTNTGERTMVAFKSPAGRRMWMEVRLGGSAPSSCGLYEATGVVVGSGSTLTPRNGDRMEPNEAGVKDRSTAGGVEGVLSSYDLAQVVVAAPSLATPVWTSQVGVGAVPVQGPLFLLAPGTEYACLVESLNNDDNYQTIEMVWWEE